MNDDPAEAVVVYVTKLHGTVELDGESQGGLTELAETMNLRRGG